MPICRALLKYGHEKFSLEIMEYCDPSMLLERENHYFKQLKPEYNILQKAGNCLGFKHSEETLAKMSKAKLGKQRSIETIEKLRVPHAGQVLLKKGKQKPAVRSWKWASTWLPPVLAKN